MARQQSEELLVSICFLALAEYLHWPPVTPDMEQLEAFPVHVMELLEDSCLLPALASYLMNDSGLLENFYYLETKIFSTKTL